MPSDYRGHITVIGTDIEAEVEEFVQRLVDFSQRNYRYLDMHLMEMEFHSVSRNHIKILNSHALYEVYLKQELISVIFVCICGCLVLRCKI